MKTAIVTGAAKGIGAAISERLASRGYSVVLNSRRGGTSAARVVGKILSNHGEACEYNADVSVPEQADELVSFSLNRYGRIDLLINNAGVWRGGLLQSMDFNDYRYIMDNNFGSAFNMCRSVIPLMIKNRSGSIINISSIWGRQGAACESVYSASKAAIIGLTQSLALELAPTGISVNCIAPGAIDTDMNADYSDADRREIISEIPFGRFGTPEEVAEAVVMLAEMPYTTGQVICQAGGMLL